jgi:hypothetical protein
MTPAAFRASLTAEAPPAGASPALAALWHAARGEWDRAHEVVQGHEGVAACDWVHAHLHRVEGDTANAGYWYRRAGRTPSRDAFEKEREAMIEAIAADR